MAKRVGANARNKMQSQKQMGATWRKNALEKIQQQMKKVVIVLLFVGVCGLLGLGISKWQASAEFRIFETPGVEWSGISIPDFKEDSAKKMNLGEDLYWHYAENSWFLVSEKGTVEKFEYPTHRLPVVEVDKGLEKESLVAFLTALKKEENGIFKELAQVLIKADCWKVVLESSSVPLRLHPKNDPLKALVDFAKFQRKYYEELKEIREVDLRFPGYVFASKREE